MDKKRLLEIIDLVEQAERLWRCEEGKTTHCAEIVISNNEGPIVRVYENVGGKPSTNTTYQHNKPHYINGIISDPDLKGAEAHIRRLLEEAE